MYLANDVIQNSKKKGPEYGKEFGKVLKNAFQHIGETCHSDEKTLGSLSRILKIWVDRGVYEEKAIEEFRSSLLKPGESGGGAITTEKSNSSSSSKRKNTEGLENGRDAAKKVKSSSSNSGGKEHGKRETIEVNGTVETHVILSPKAPAGKFHSPMTRRKNEKKKNLYSILFHIGDPPEPEELIKALLSLENSASSDANIRERIASLPPEVSEISLLAKLEDKEAAAKLAVQVRSNKITFGFFVIEKYSM